MVANGFLQEHPYDAGVYPTGQAKQDLAVTDLLTNFGYFNFDEVFHGPVALGPTDIESEVAEQVIPVLRVTHFWVELDAVDLTGWVLEGRHWAVIVRRRHAESFWDLND